MKEAWTTTIGRDIAKAVHWLAAGEVVAIPTETVYGLAANGLSEPAIRKIFAAKNRPFFNPLILHIGDVSWLERYAAEVPEKARRLAEAFWPGPLTLVLPKKSVVPDLLTAGHPTVALRMPRHPMTLQLIRQLDFPLAAPSANPFGYISPTTARHVHDQMAGQLPYILDGGPCDIGLESTIVSFENGNVRMLRPGGMSREALEKVVGPITVGQTSDEGGPQAPGMLKSHYAPARKLFFGDIETLLEAVQLPPEQVAVLSFSKPYPQVPAEQQIVLSLTGSLDDAAKNLFDALRTLDQLPVDCILAEEFPNEQIGVAINDRLRRAASE